MASDNRGSSGVASHTKIYRDANSAQLPGLNIWNLEIRPRLRVSSRLPEPITDQMIAWRNGDHPALRQLTSLAISLERPGEDRE